MIGRDARPLEHVALVVRTGGDLVFGGERLHLVLGIARPAGLGEVAEGDVFQRMAVRADLAIDLEAALQLGRVVAAENAGERP